MINYTDNKENKNVIGRLLHTQDGHGGMAEEHHAEMEEIARRVYAEEHQRDMEEIKTMIEELLPIAYKQAVEDFLGALEYDIESVTRIGFDGCRDIFEDRKAQKYISDHIMKEITKQLNNKRFRK